MTLPKLRNVDLKILETVKIEIALISTLRKSVNHSVSLVREHRHPYGVCYEWQNTGLCYKGDECRNKHPIEMAAPRTPNAEPFLGQGSPSGAHREGEGWRTQPSQWSHLKSGQRMKISGFNSFNRNRQNKYMGGISTSVANKDTMHTLKVKEGAEDDEFLITRHSQFVVPVNIVNVYGEQEGRSSKDDIQNRWNRIMIEIVKIESKNEVVVLLGDLNKHVGDIIEGNHAKVTFGGNLIRNMLKTEKYYLVNSSPKVEGGPFTRYDPADPTSDSKKSCLDLFIISKELLKYVDKLIIDNNFIFTPSRPISKIKMVYPDHF